MPSRESSGPPIHNQGGFKKKTLLRVDFSGESHFDIFTGHNHWKERVMIRQSIILVFIILFVIGCAAGGYNPFIYFRFYNFL